jgi:hypothetical protein
MADRERVGREPSPTAAVVDAQAARSGGTGVAGRRGYDTAKRVVGRKRPAHVDTDGRLLLAAVSPADMHDSHGGVALLRTSRRSWPFLALCYADRAYAGSPGTAVSSRNGRGKRFWFAQQGAEVLPHQLIELTGRGVPRRAAGRAMREAAVPLAVAQIAEVSPVDGAGRAGQAAAAATHQGAQQVLVRRVVHPGKGAVCRQLRLNLPTARRCRHRETKHFFMAAAANLRDCTLDSEAEPPRPKES